MFIHFNDFFVILKKELEFNKYLKNKIDLWIYGFANKIKGFEKLISCKIEKYNNLTLKIKKKEKKYEFSNDVSYGIGLIKFENRKNLFFKKIIESNQNKDSHIFSWKNLFVFTKNNRFLKKFEKN